MADDAYYQVLISFLLTCIDTCSFCFCFWFLFLFFFVFFFYSNALSKRIFFWNLFLNSFGLDKNFLFLIFICFYYLMKYKNKFIVYITLWIVQNIEWQKEIEIQYRNIFLLLSAVWFFILYFMLTGVKPLMLYRTCLPNHPSFEPVLISFHSLFQLIFCKTFSVLVF